MPRSKYTRMIIGVDGSCQIDALNFTRPACKAASREIANALAGRINHQHDKPEARIRERCGEREQEGAR